jgi:hypothetical protein
MNARKVSIGVAAVAMGLAVLACSGSVSTANVAEAWMSADEAGDVRTTSYAPDAVFYAQADLQNAPDDTVIKAVWTAVDVVDVEPGMVISETEFTTGSGLVHFTLSNDSPWPTGTYKAEIFLGEELVQTLEFSVQ